MPGYVEDLESELAQDIQTYIKRCLLRVLFFNPIFTLVGAAAGALSGALSDIAINDDFMRDLGSTIEPGTSAIFVLVRKSTPDYLR
jgi:uncharacterized membrane protein